MKRGPPPRINALANLTKITLIICRKKPELINRFLELNGFETISKELDLKSGHINVEIFKLCAFMVDHGPERTINDIMNNQIPKKLILFWEDTKTLVENMQKKCNKIKNFKETCLGEQGPSTPEESKQVTEYKLSVDLMNSGFFLFNEIMKKNPKIFDNVSNKFHAASCTHLMTFIDEKQGQNNALNFMAGINMNDDMASALLDNGFINTIFETKLKYTNWNHYGLNTERILLKMCDMHAKYINKLRERDAVKCVVAALHFIHDGEDDDDVEDRLNTYYAERACGEKFFLNLSNVIGIKQ